MGTTESTGIDPSWQVVVSQRLAIAELLAGLSDADWERHRCAPAGGCVTSPHT